MQNNTFSSKLKTQAAMLMKSKGMASFTATLLAIGLGLIFGFIVMLIASPANALDGFITMLFGGLGRIGDVFYFATPILMTGLSVGFAFKMGLFNIGASGQYTFGMFFALYVGFMVKLPTGIHWIACILAGMIGGMLWGFIPGLLKATLNVHEVITSIMFNYIGMYLVDMFIMNNSKMYVSTMTRTAYLPTSAQIPSLGVANSNVNISVIFAIVIAILLFVVLSKTTFGYELKATGLNKHASKYAGMNDTKNTIFTMIIAGGLAGLGGAFAILAPSSIAGSSMTYEPINIIAANGFNGIAVALLGSSNPIGIIFSALFVSHIQRGGTLVSGFFGYKPEIIDVVIAVIIYFSAFAMLMSAALGRLIKKRKKVEMVKKPEVTINDKDNSRKENKEA
jgi:general nucleoside transport system permease protein